MRTYDVIVIGLGAMGGAAAYHCARRGARVLGLDANPPYHALGSSHGTTRAIREAYYEAPDYVPLIWRSFALWRELEAETGTRLLTIGGGLYIGPGEHPLLTGVAAAAERHGLTIERLTREEVIARYPGLAIPENWWAVRESNAGLLRAKECLRAHVDLAGRHGAELRFGRAARQWERTDGDGVRVTTDAGAFDAGAVIIALGPWAGGGLDGLLDGLGLPLSVRRVPVVYFEPAEAAYYDPTRMSIVMCGTPEGVFAGFPDLDGEGIKVLCHDGGEVCTPATVRRDVTDADIRVLARFADTYMPYANRGVRTSVVCLYTMTPDAHFIIDRHPGSGNVAYAAGFSGHGFKFAPVVGEILADLALEGRSRHPIDFFSAERLRHLHSAAR